MPRIDADAIISPASKVTISVVVVVIGGVWWGARTDTRVDRLEQERIELKSELRRMQATLEDIRERLPPRRQ